MRFPLLVTSHLQYYFCLQPKQLRSPTWVQKFRKGNCFECATFLASLLLGQGYNAFVISGYASKEQTLCDSTRKSCPCVPRPDKQAGREPKAEQPEITKYKLKLLPEYNSQFLLKLEEEEARKLEEKLLSDEKEQQKLIEVSQSIFYFFFFFSFFSSPLIVRKNYV